MIKSSVAEVVEVNTREEGGTVNDIDIKDLSENSDLSQLALPPIALEVYSLFLLPLRALGFSDC